MKHIKSPRDAGRALMDGADPRVMSVVLALVLNLQDGFAAYGGWVPEDHGWVILLEDAGDLDKLEELHLGEPFFLTPWEEVTHHAECGCFAATAIMNNDFGLTYVVPETLLTPEQRAALEAELRPPTPAR